MLSTDLRAISSHTGATTLTFGLLPCKITTTCAALPRTGQSPQVQPIRLSR